MQCLYNTKVLISTSLPEAATITSASVDLSQSLTLLHTLSRFVRDAAWRPSCVGFLHSSSAAQRSVVGTAGLGAHSGRRAHKQAGMGICSARPHHRLARSANGKPGSCLCECSPRQWPDQRQQLLQQQHTAVAAEPPGSCSSWQLAASELSSINN